MTDKNNSDKKIENKKSNNQNHSCSLKNQRYRNLDNYTDNHFYNDPLCDIIE